MTALNDTRHIPQHVAIIMDGNGRWATSRGLPRTEGHKAGAEAVIRTVDYCQKYGVKYLTLYAFSTENWKRSPAEIAALMQLLSDFMDRKANDILKNHIRLRVIGQLNRIPWPARTRLQKLIKQTEAFTAHNLTIALSYGSRTEMTDAAAQLARDALDGRIKPENIDESAFAARLQTADLPDPDLLIRTAGEQRLSNFLLWQLSYAEFWFTDTLWPDFDEDDFNQALDAFSKRQRRYGKA